MSDSTFLLPDVTNATLSAVYTEIDKNSANNVFPSHVHNECEIYINVSGDVSFVVENTVYPIIPGSVIITRPGEYHHCVYHSDALHRHFWILISADKMNGLLTRFYDREAGRDNMLILSGARFKELSELCYEICENKASDNDSLYRFFKLIHLINIAEVAEVKMDEEATVMDRALNFINSNIGENILIKDISDAAFVSVSTLERYFEKNLHTTPSSYLKKRRLALSADLLLGGASVTEACHRSGFSDCSKFIELFRKHYGLTPLKWKKEASSRNAEPQ